MYLFAGVRDRKRKHLEQNEQVAQVKTKPKPCGKIECGPCFQCTQPPRRSVTWKHLCTLKNKNLIQVIKERTPTISDVDCICDSCRQLCYKRSQGKQVCTPLSKKKGKLGTLTEETVPLKKCFLVNTMQSPCDDAKVHENVMFSLDQILSCFDIQIEVPDEVPLSGVTLCHKHYCRMCNYTSIKNCAARQCLLKQGTFSRTCNALQDVDYASKILRQISPNIVVGKDTVLCNSCFMLVYNERNSVTLDNIEHRQLKDLKSQAML